MSIEISNPPVAASVGGGGTVSKLRTYMSKTKSVTTSSSALEAAVAEGIMLTNLRITAGTGTAYIAFAEAATTAKFPITNGDAPITIPWPTGQAVNVIGSVAGLTLEYDLVTLPAGESWGEPLRTNTVGSSSLTNTGSTALMSATAAGALFLFKIAFAWRKGAGQNALATSLLMPTGVTTIGPTTTSITGRLDTDASGTGYYVKGV